MIDFNLMLQLPEIFNLTADVICITKDQYKWAIPYLFYALYVVSANILIVLYVVLPNIMIAQYIKHLAVIVNYNRPKHFFYHLSEKYHAQIIAIFVDQAMSSLYAAILTS